jgi:uncharacterized protein (DUF58 family)
MRRFLSARGRSLEIAKAGWLFIVITLAVGFAAINTASNLLHALFGVQLGLIVASGALSERMVSRARPRRVVTSPLFAGSPGALRIELENTGPNSPLLSVSVEDDDENPSGVGQTAPVYSLVIPGGGTVRLETSVTMPRRGPHRLPPAVVLTRFPFGLFVKRRRVVESAEVLVYPRLSFDPGATAGMGVAGDEQGSGRPARAGEFHSLAEYRAGEDSRRIHWPATARRGRPVVARFEAQRDGVAWVEVGTGRPGEAGFEAAIERAASRAVTLLRSGGASVGLSIDGTVAIEPGHGVLHERRILDALARCGFELPTDEADLGAAALEVQDGAGAHPGRQAKGAA